MVVSIQTNNRKDRTMQRLTLILLVALLLAGCTMPAAPPRLSTPTPDPEAAFDAAYADVEAGRVALNAAMRDVDPNDGLGDATQRAEIQRAAAEWRTAINALRYLEQPAGEGWERAWPRITDAMAEFAFLASLIESAARDNNMFVLYQGSGRAEAAVALLEEAMEILGRE